MAVFFFCFSDYLLQTQTCWSVDAAVGWIWGAAVSRRLALVSCPHILWLHCQSVAAASSLVSLVDVPHIGCGGQARRSRPASQDVSATTFWHCAGWDAADSWRLRDHCKSKIQRNSHTTKQAKDRGRPPKKERTLQSESCANWQTPTLLWIRNTYTSSVFVALISLKSYGQTYPWLSHQLCSRLKGHRRWWQHKCMHARSYPWPRWAGCRCCWWRRSQLCHLPSTHSWPQPESWTKCTSEWLSFHLSPLQCRWQQGSGLSLVQQQGQQKISTNPKCHDNRPRHQLLIFS